MNPSPPSLQPNQDLVPSPAKDLELIEKKQDRIVEGAGRLFFEKGFHRTTIREIALAAGMSMGQLYHYISSKDDVLFLVYRHMQALWARHLEAAGVERSADPRVRLSEALGRTLEFMLENKDLFLFIYTETKYLDRKHLRVVLQMDDQNVVGFWRRLLADLQAEGPLAAEPDFAANLISYLLLFLVLRGWNLKGARPRENIAAVISFVQRGLGLEP